MDTDQTNSTFHTELKEFKAKHGDEAEGLLVVRFVDRARASADSVPTDTYTCVRLPDGNMECWHSGREI
jgi:hypothetical protein